MPDLTLRVYTSDYANEVVVDVIKNEYEIVGDTINNRGNLIDSSGFVASETADGMTGKLIMQGVKSLFDTYQWYAIADTYSAYDVVTSGKIGDIFHQKQLTIDPIPSEFLAWKEDENYLVPTTDTYQVIHYTIKDVPFTDVGWYEKAREWLYGTYGEVLFTEDVEVTYVVSYDCLGIVENIKARIGYASDAASFAACVSDYVAAVDIGGRNEPEDAFLTAEVLKGFDDRFYGTKERYLGHFGNARYCDVSYNACESIKELPQIELSAMDQAQTLFDRKYQSFTFRPGEILDVTTTMFDGSPCETKTYASK